MDMLSSNLQQQKFIIEQLRREANITDRQPISMSCSTMLKYIAEHEQEDYLLTGFSSQKVNPFREKSSCTVL